MSDLRLFAGFAMKRGKRPVRVVLDDPETMARVADIFQAPQIGEPQLVAFRPERTVEADEWFYLELGEEDLAVMIGPYRDSLAHSAGANQLTGEDYQQVESLFMNTTDGGLVFSKITPSLRLEDKKFIGFGTGHPELIQHQRSLEFTGRVDAYWRGDRLYFKNYSTIRPLFSGIEKYFRAASDEEKTAFLAHEFFAVGKDEIKIGLRAAKRIAAILDDQNIDLNDRAAQHKITAYAERYPQAGIVITPERKLEITTPHQLSSVLSLLSGRYYTSELTGEKMEAREAWRLEK